MTELEIIEAIIKKKNLSDREKITGIEAVIESKSSEDVFINIPNEISKIKEILTRMEEQLESISNQCEKIPNP